MDMDTRLYKASGESPNNVTSVTPQIRGENSGVTENVTDAMSDLFEVGFSAAWDAQQRKTDALQIENDGLRERIDELESDLCYEEDRANCFESEAAAAWDELGY